MKKSEDTEDDFLGFVRLGSMIDAIREKCGELAKRDDMLAATFFRIGWAAAKSGKWESADEAIKYSRELLKDKLRAERR